MWRTPTRSRRSTRRVCRTWMRSKSVTCMANQYHCITTRSVRIKQSTATRTSLTTIWRSRSSEPLTYRFPRTSKPNTSTRLSNLSSHILLYVQCSFHITFFRFLDFLHEFFEKIKLKGICPIRSN